MNARDRWLVNLGFDAGWDAHATYLNGGAGEQEPKGARVEAGNETSEQPQAIRADAPTA